MSERKGGAPGAGSAGLGAFRGESPLKKRDLLDRLEKAIGRLADGSAPLEELVAAHQEALELLDEAEAELKALRSRADELIRSLTT